MVRDLSEDKEQGEKAATRLEQRNIVHGLIGLRIAGGLSQSDMAQRMGCTQSKVSKFESGRDNDLRIGDLYGYTDALGLEMTIYLGKKGRTIADRMRSRVSEIRFLIGQLTKWASHEDDAIANGAGLFVVEQACHLADTLLGALRGVSRFLPKLPPEKPRHMTIDQEYEEARNGTVSAPC
jgi:transcriptional regulator with XRE-family HTH domain